MGKTKKEKKTEMTVAQCMFYTLGMIFKADKPLVIYTFYKQISEMVFNSFFFVYMTQLIFSYIEKEVAFDKLVMVVLIFCGIHVIAHFVSAGHAYYLRLQTPKVYKYMYLKVIDKASTIELTRYEQPDFYDKFSRTLDECLKKAVDAMMSLSYAVGNIAATISSVAIISAVDPVLILIIFPPIVGALIFGIIENKEQLELRKNETQTKRAMEYVKRVFYEKKYASEIRLYDVKDILFKKYRDNYMERGDITMYHKKRIAFYEAMETVFFAGISVLGSYVYVTYRIKVSGVASIGAYVAIISSIGFMSWLFKDSIKKLVEAGKYSIYMQNLKDFLEYDPGLIARGDRKVEGQLGDIEFDHVNFQYEGSDHNVIQNLTFRVKKGEKIALVGENGAGKTTLVKLLMGLYPVTEGTLKVGGVSVTDYEPKSYHKHLGAVFQDLQIFSLPLSENVLMRQPNTEEERQLIIDSLEKAQFQDTLDSLEKGIDTMISKEFDPDGFVCSGGQAQKIAIARVFAKNPDIVILDEPSSALDPIAEYNMYNNMMQVSEGKTVFFISHRLSSARIADRIYFLENGTILETGTHEELMKAGGQYAKMFSLQAQNYQEHILEELKVDCMEGGMRNE